MVAPSGCIFLWAQPPSAKGKCGALPFALIVNPVALVMGLRGARYPYKPDTIPVDSVGASPII
jgi:hypothetical protein